MTVLLRRRPRRSHPERGRNSSRRRDQHHSRSGLVRAHHYALYALCDAPDRSVRSLRPVCYQILAIKAAIANAKTLEEVTRLERALRTGMLPEELGGPKPASADSMVE